MIERELLESKVEQISETKFKVTRVIKETRSDEVTIGELEQIQIKIKDERSKASNVLNKIDTDYAEITNQIEVAKSLQKEKTP